MVQAENFAQKSLLKKTLLKQKSLALPTTSYFSIEIKKVY